MGLKRTLFFLLALPLWVGSAWAGDRITLPLADAPSRGPANAPVTIVEFLDFQ